MELLKDKNGFYFYNELPPEFRLASITDFVNMPVCIAKSKPFLIHGYHSNTYDCFRMYPGFKIEKILPWLNDKRVFVLEK